MIHYHGGPISPLTVADMVWRGRHAFVSFERPDQIALAAHVAQSFALDNGAYSAWSSGKALDIKGYSEWVKEWSRHPGFDWCLIPDTIDGSEKDNVGLIAQWRELSDFSIGVPVWHMHESLDRLRFMTVAWRRIAIGSSGAYAVVGSSDWWERMAEVMSAVCDDEGRPKARLHGLRMLNPEIFSALPLSSADSTNVARNHARESRRYQLTNGMGAIVTTARVESAQSAATWTRRASTLPLFGAGDAA